MRIHFQERPWDLYVCVIYAVVLSVLLFVSKTGNSIGVFLIFFAPGHVLIATLFPGNSEISWIERLVLNIGASIVIVPLLGFFLDLSPWGMGFDPVIVSVGTFTIITAMFAYLRRMRLPPADRLGVSVLIDLPLWRTLGFRDKALTFGLVVAVLLASAGLATLEMASVPGSHSTEFYILGPGGNASGYPTRLKVSEPGTVILGVVNHESTRVTYTIRVDLVGLNLVFNTSCNCNQTQEVNRTSIAWRNQTLGDKENWTQPYTFWINATGLWKLEFLLYKNAILTTQTPHLFIRVP